MRSAAILAMSVALAACATVAPPGPDVATLLQSAPLVDGHNDLLIHYLADDQKSWATVDAYDIGGATRGQVDLPRLRAGRVGAAIFTVGILNEQDREAGIRESTGLLRALATRHSDDLEVVTDAAGLQRAFAAKRIAALLGLEGGDQIGGSIEVLRVVHRHGVRAMTLTWEKTNEIGDSSADAPRFDGLSPFGVEVVREMNRLGMLVDLSHAADTTAFDVLDVTQAPVILSHSATRALCPSPRNAPDDLLRRVAANGGLVMVDFVPYHVSADHWSWYRRGDEHWAVLVGRHGSDRESARREMARWEAENPPPPVTLAQVADHVEHVRRVAGVDHVGIGSDFDGMDAYAIDALEHAGAFPTLFEELARRGWSESDLRKLAGENFLRVLRAVEAARGAS